MTHTPEVERLLKAIDDFKNHDCSMNWDEVLKARAAFEPKEEFEYVLPKEQPYWWFEFLRELQPSWNALRELTKRPKPKGKEYWLVRPVDGPRTWHDYKPTYDLLRYPDIHVREVEETK